MYKDNQLNSRNVVVTGGAGFIGSNLVRRLSLLGAEVTIVDDLSAGLKANIPADHNVTLVEQDVRDLEGLCATFQESDCVFHLAALGSVPRSIEQPPPTYDVNLMGSVNVFEAARLTGVQRVIYASSSSVYGDASGTYKVEGSEGSPISPYAASKAAVELVAAAHGRCYNLETIGLRFFNVFGPFQRPDAAYAAVVPLFTDALLNGRKPLVYGDGLQVRDFTYVEDVVQALLLAATSEHSFIDEVVNVSGGYGLSVLDLLEEIKGATGILNVEPEMMPARTGDIRVSRADISQALTLLGFEPDWAVGDGLKRYVEWYLQALKT